MPANKIMSFMHRLVAPFQPVHSNVKHSWVNFYTMLKNVYFIKNEDTDFAQFLTDTIALLGRGKAQEAFKRLRDNKATYLQGRNQKSNNVTASTKTGKTPIILKDAEYVQMAFDLKQKHPSKNVMIMNLANDVRIGGALLYKKGTAEEYLCRNSDLFIEMLLNHVPDDKPMKAEFLKFILQNVLNIHQNKPSTPLTSFDSNYMPQVAAFIYGLEGEENGYQIKPDAPHASDIFVYNPALNLNQIDNASQLTKETFEKNTLLIQDVDAAAVDLRWIYSERGLVSKNYGLTIDKQKFIDETTKRIEAIMEASANADIYDFSALGCGAFKNNPQWVAQSFANVFNKKAKDLKGKMIYFGIYADNYNNFLQALSQHLDGKHFELFDKGKKEGYDVENESPVTIANTKARRPEAQHAYEVGQKSSKAWLPYMQSWVDSQVWNNLDDFHEGFDEKVKAKTKKRST